MEKDQNESLENILVDEKITGIEKELARITAGFQTTMLETMPHGKIREEFFVNVFLPYFAGELKREDFPEGITPETWYQISGNPTNRVDVINAKGEILFSVPPLHNPNFLAPNTDNKHSTFSKAGLYISELQGIGRSNEANNILKKEILKRVPMRRVDIKKAYYEEWAKIFIRYGYFLPEEEINDKKNDEPPSLEGLVEWE